ncbi:unnamed protein product [Paramecium octaurelia]|uniref:Uncharacterized protein n=1 Tax=Paramecium octaurelia TaxID=43137 RepID=A0A8S1VMY2_PAROT|nr:unnamed protein product [Paramecium octaurelia]
MLVKQTLTNQVYQNGFIIRNLKSKAICLVNGTESQINRNHFFLILQVEQECEKDYIRKKLIIYAQGYIQLEYEIYLITIETRVFKVFLNNSKVQLCALFIDLMSTYQKQLKFTNQRILVSYTELG